MANTKYYLYLTLFCLACFFLSDATTINGGICESSPCSTYNSSSWDNGRIDYFLKSATFLPLAPLNIFRGLIIKQIRREYPLVWGAGRLGPYHFTFVDADDDQFTNARLVATDKIVIPKIFWSFFLLHLLNITWWILLFWLITKLMERYEGIRRMGIKFAIGCTIYFLLSINVTEMRDWLSQTGEADMTLQFLFGIVWPNLELYQQQIAMALVMPIYPIFWLLSHFR